MLRKLHAMLLAPAAYASSANHCFSRSW
jgi:hypothetical protein